jgi:hypothetical protein
MNLSSKPRLEIIVDPRSENCPDLAHAADLISKHFDLAPRGVRIVVRLSSQDYAQLQRSSCRILNRVSIVRRIDPSA